MAPPPVTPSPHRFLAKPQPKKATEASGSKLKHKALPPPSGETTARAIPKFNTASVSTPAPRNFNDVTRTPVARGEDVDQFAATPKFGHARPSSPKRPRLQQRGDEGEHEAGRFATPRRFANENALPEMIHDNGPTAPPHPPSKEEGEFATPQTTRHTFLPQTHTHTQDPSSSPPLPLRPVFLPPPTSAATLAAPLPEAFSPHRKGDKFLPGGMADTVRQWVLEMSQHQARGSNSYSVRVLEVSGGAGMALVRCEGDVRICLISGRGRGRVDVGCVVLVKGMSWEVEVEGCVWRVVSEWRVVREDG